MPSGTLAIINDPTFTAMLEQATPHLRTFARRLCGNAADADDVLQESLAKAWRHRQSFQPERDSNLDADQPGRAWLQRLTFRVFCDFRTRQQRHPSDHSEAEQQPAPTRPCPTELRDEVQHRLGTLKEIERTLLIGFHRDELSLRELAQQHQLPVNTVKSHLHRARLRLLDAGPGATP